MAHHKRSVSCTAIPSFPTLPSHSSTSLVSSISSSTSCKSVFVKAMPAGESDQAEQCHDSSLSNMVPMVQSESKSELASLLKGPSLFFTLPSACLFSRQALTNESAADEDIVQFVTPGLPLDRMALLAGVLESLGQVVGDIAVEEEEDTLEEDSFCNHNCSEDEDDDRKHDDNNHDVTVLGLGSFKIAIYDSLIDTTQDKLSLMVMVSTKLSDDSITKTMALLKEDLFQAFGDHNLNTADRLHTFSMLPMQCTVEDVGERLVSLVRYWFQDAETTN